MTSTTIKTKYGKATLNPHGYYELTTDQGEYSRALHRRIWEDFYGRTIPKNCVIHHINEDKTDNRIQNLHCCTKEVHKRYHAKRRTFKHTEEWKKRASLFRTGQNHPYYGKKRTIDEMKGIISYKIKISKLSQYDQYWGLVYLMHRKNAGLSQRDIISEMGLSSSSYISAKLKRLRIKWSDL